MNSNHLPPSTHSPIHPSTHPPIHPPSSFIPHPSDSSFRWDTLLFAEGGARILVSVSSEDIAVWESYLTEQLGGFWQRLGQVGAAGGKLRISTADNHSLIDATIEEMGDRWLNAIEHRL